MKAFLGLKNVRSRLTLAHVLALSFSLVAYSATLYLLYRNNAYSELDEKLQNDFEKIDDQIELIPKEDGISTDTGNWITEVWNSGGKRVYTSGSPGEYPLGNLDPKCLAKGLNASTQGPGGIRLRTYCQESSTHHGSYWIRVARISEKAALELQKFLTLILLGSPLIILFSGVLGYWLARRALNPLSQMAKAARSITASRLSERLPVPNPEDELGRLATAFNSAFEGLEKSFQQMKRFTADTSHELRTPLTAIRTMGEVALRDRGKTKDPYDTLSNILEETDHLRALCENLLLLSRADSGQIMLKLEKTNVAALVHEVISLLSVLAEEKGQTIDAKLPKEIMADLDPALFRQVITNLIDNAIKHSPNGTRIEVSGSHSNDEVRIEVRDQGPGIPEAQQALIFERFYRIDKSRSRAQGAGAGLGLSIALWAARLHGGSIELQSKAGVGSRFVVEIPTHGKESV